VKRKTNSLSEPLRSMTPVPGDINDKPQEVRTRLSQVVIDYVMQLERLPIGPMADDMEARRDIAVAVLRKLESNDYALLREWSHRHSTGQGASSWRSMLKAVTMAAAIERERASRESTARPGEWAVVEPMSPGTMNSLIDATLELSVRTSELTGFGERQVVHEARELAAGIALVRRLTRDQYEVLLRSADMFGAPFADDRGSSTPVNFAAPLDNVSPVEDHVEQLRWHIDRGVPPPSHAERPARLDTQQASVKPTSRTRVSHDSVAAAGAAPATARPALRAVAAGVAGTSDGLVTADHSVAIQFEIQEPVEILERRLESQRAAQTEVVRRLAHQHAAALQRTATRLVGRNEADDVAQEAFIKLVRWVQDRPASEVKALLDNEKDVQRMLTRATAISAYDLLRRRANRREQLVARGDESELGSDATAKGPRYTDASITQLERAYAQLPPLQRVAHVLRHHCGYTVADLAETLGRSESQIRWLVYRANVALKNALREQGSE
jgi:RNA polymerase sigma-70 factor (ECF subfamily)